jgi:small subunit ribosomal protein S16
MRRIGKNPKKRPFFRISVFDEQRNRDGKFIEEIGFYNPISKAIKLEKERLDYWVSKGAQVSPSVKNVIKRSVAKKETKDASADSTD